MFAQLDEHTQLRPLLPCDAATLAACVDNARQHLAKWTVLASRVVDHDSARQLLAQYATPPRYFGIRRNEALVGGALYRAFNPHSGMCEIGGWLTPDAQGHGLITKAFRQLIRWAVELHGMHRIELLTSPDNRRARAIAQRLGMSHKSTVPGALLLNGTWHDSEVWTLTIVSSA